jgi:hypothetical protein
MRKRTIAPPDQTKNFFKWYGLDQIRKNTNLKKFFDFDHWRCPYEVNTLKNGSKGIFPESGSDKHFHVSTMRVIDSPPSKTLVRSKISSKINLYSQRKHGLYMTCIARYQHFKIKLQHWKTQIFLKKSVYWHERKHELFSKRPIGSYTEKNFVENGFPEPSRWQKK